MIAHIVNNHQIVFDNMTAHEEDILWREFSVARPGARFIDPDSSWDGVYRFFNRARRTMARPLLSKLRAVCSKHGLPLRVIDDREPDRYPPIDLETIGPDFLPGITLEDYQIDAVKKACKAECGIINAVTGAGKTECIAAICKAIPCPTLILADQTVVIDQIKERIELRSVVEEVGLFYAGRRPNDQLVVVGSIQSLSPPKKAPVLPVRSSKDTDKAWEKKLKKYDAMKAAYNTRRKNAAILQKMAKKAHQVLVDECVHEDSLITTDAGLMRAKELERLVESGTAPRALVAGSTHEIVAVSRSFKPALKIVTSSNRELIVSDNHRCTTLRYNAVQDDYATELQVGDLLLTANRDNACGVDEAWWHIGLFIGDGHWMKKCRHRVRFAVRKDLDDWRFAVDSMADYWGGEVTSDFNRRGDLILCLDSERFCAFLSSLGFKPGRKCGKMTADFAVPGYAEASGLLRGLFDAEGTPYRHHARLAMTDQAVVRYGQCLMSYLGIASSVGYGRRKNPKHAPLWRLVVSGENYMKFSERVGFGFSRKSVNYRNSLDSNRLIDPKPHYAAWLSSGLPASKLAKCLGVLTAELSNDSKVSLRRLISYYDAVRCLAESRPSTYADAKDVWGASYTRIASRAGISAMTVWNRRRRGDDSPWIDWVDGVATKLGQTSGIASDLLQHYAVESIKSVERVGPQPLLDFTVSDAHRFEANGLLVHNCDKCSSEAYKHFFQHVFKGRRRYGFSGTPYTPEKPVEAMRVQQHLGSEIIRIERAQVEERGRIVPIEYTMFFVDGDPHEASAFDIAFKEHVTNSERFWKLVTAVVKKYPSDGTLILVDKEELGWNLKAYLQRHGIRSEFIFGKTPKKRRTEVLKEFERRDLKVLIGGKIVDRGLDLKGGCENLFNATGGMQWSSTVQKIGRAVRVNSAGKSRVFDVFFKCNRYLYKHSRVKLTSVVNLHYEASVLHTSGRIDGADLVRRRFRFPR